MTTNPTGQRVSDELLDRWVEVSEGKTGAILTWPEMRDLIADLRAAREEVQHLRGRIDAALTVLDTQWRWCYGRKRISPDLVRAALGGGSSD